MLRLISDENFNGDIVRGLLRRHPSLDLIRVQDTGLLGADDAMLLTWAANERRILLTHDQATMPSFAQERIQRGEFMAGMFVISNRLPMGKAIDEIVLVMECSNQVEWESIVAWLPF